MPRSGNIPSYCLHKPSGQARVIIAGKHVYLGIYGSPESREKYARLITERFREQAQQVSLPAQPAAMEVISINELLLRYLQFAMEYYVEDGKPTGEVGNLRDAMRPLRNLYGLTAPRDFGPKALKLVRQYMIDHENLSRGVINSRIDRLKRAFKWAVSEELIPPSIYEALRTVKTWTPTSGSTNTRSGGRDVLRARLGSQSNIDSVLLNAAIRFASARRWPSFPASSAP